MATEAATQGLPLQQRAQNTDKRDSLIEYEKKYQKEWADANLFVNDAPTDSEGEKHKYFGTTAYPYMNGTLHAGHAFTFSKIEFGTGFARMEGKRTLFPQGFHCSGMPIKAAADKLAREIELFGEKFERYEEEELAASDAQGAQAKTDLSKFSGSKSKAVAKSGTVKYQFQIMASLGIPVEEVSKFADPAYWLTYFPGLCREDLTAFGCRVDWRRSMVTTDANPYYDAFVRWQMNRLKELEKVKFGKRYTIYSPKDGQPCLDHDRSAGEGIGVQEYTCVKLQTLEWSDRAKEVLGDKIPKDANVYFIPATLRPETVYGMTCCFVGPKVNYGVFLLSPEKNEYVVATPRAARNMAYQNLSPGWGLITQIAELVGSDLVGTLVNAPLSAYKDGIRILPMESLKDNKGTAVVACVPSDSPDDYATTLELQKKPEFYGIKKEWVDKEIVPLIETPKGNLIAKTLYEELGINSPKDAKPLAEAKEVAYKLGFYQGTMIFGDYAGKSVQDARTLVGKQLSDEDLAFKYAEPDGLVISRSADECIAAYLDQWYFNYGTAENGGDGEWCQTVLDYLEEEFNCYYPEAKHAFEQALGWLAHWACSRSFGLGTKIPWDASQLVESLSDSTVYMAYYTICHYLHSDIFGKNPGISKKPITPEQMTDEVWDYIFFRSEKVETDIAPEDLAAMRKEFSYWYPMDIRISGKDLITNHLTFSLYHHIALFPKRFWPRSFRVNGHLMLNGSKMSKSTGNFMTLRQAINKYGTDATRLALAEAGDGIEDANLEETVANSAILRLYELRKWSKDALEEDNLRTGELSFFDKLFDNDLRGLVIETKKSYEGTFYKAALKTGFYDFQTARDWYRENCRAAGVGMHVDLVRRFVELQALLVTPIIPHWSEYIWREVLKKDSSIQSALYPTVSPPDPILVLIREYIKQTTNNILQAEAKQVKKINKGKQASYDPTKSKKLTIYVAEKYPEFQQRYRDVLQKHLEAEGNTDIKAVISKIDKKDMKKAMPLLQHLKKRLESGEPPERVFERQLPFSETDVLREMVPGLRAGVRKLEVVEIVRLRDDGKADVAFVGADEQFLGAASKVGDVVDGLSLEVAPGTPAVFFGNIEASSS
ncbi:unnamed protein product [Clonostachys chloroleuca]|uniref:leucine--tRNA ligase n=1 Tax=Clonostachys chloroleuca TaxID=1926264 RepID=A0AA35LYE1_9HYPO|nr:unnamed protein product [Clonostachys chloroleuca]